MDQKPVKKRTNDKPSTNVTDLAMSFGKLPPQNLEAEEAVLGAVMISKGAFATIAQILQAEDFYKEAHRIIYETFGILDSRHDPIDLVTVTNELRKQSKLDFVGGPYYLLELTERVGSAANLEHHCRIVFENAIKRAEIKIGSEITREGFDYTSDCFDVLDNAQAQLFALTNRSQRKKSSVMRDLVPQALIQIQAAGEQKDGLVGVPSGFTDLDRLTCGWTKSDLIIVAARPGMGKTGFVVSAMRNAAVDFKKPVALFSLEMSSIQLTNRLISSEIEISSEKLKKGNLSVQEWEKIHSQITTLTNASIYIDDTPSLSIMEVRAKARQLVTDYGVQLIIVDYLQLMRGSDSSKRSNSNREQEISEISRGLKGLAKELDVPVIALSQLSRAVETRGGDKRPYLSDLRESGSIEQDADMVMFLYRPEYYGIDVDEENNPTKGMCEVIIAKHRNGSLDTVKLRFIGQFTKFANWDFSSLPPTDYVPVEATETKSNWGNFPPINTRQGTGGMLDVLNTTDEKPF